jgi:hypothetical protein
MPSFLWEHLSAVIMLQFFFFYTNICNSKAQTRNSSNSTLALSSSPFSWRVIEWETVIAGLGSEDTSASSKVCLKTNDVRVQLAFFQGFLTEFRTLSDAQTHTLRKELLRQVIVQMRQKKGVSRANFPQASKVQAAQIPFTQACSI